MRLIKGQSFVRQDGLELVVESIKGNEVEFVTVEGTTTYYIKDAVRAIEQNAWASGQDMPSLPVKPEPTGAPAKEVLNVETTIENLVKAEIAAITSDGGSSSYYTLDINGNKVETEEIIDQVFGNDFDFGTAFKSLLRAYLATQGGGKKGNSIAYDLNKVDYSVNKVRQRHD